MTSYTLAFSGPEHDLPQRPLGVPADRCYVIASTPRSGSNLLGDLLRQCGAGVPMEYLELQVAVPTLAQRFGTDDFATYLAHLFAFRTSADGVFGVKVHWHQLTTFFKALNSGGAFQTGQEPLLRRVVEDLFPNTVWIHLGRRDIDAQARSLHRAERTGVFADLGASVPPAPTSVPLDPAEVEGRRRTLAQHEASWSRFFDASGIAPLRVTYEDLVEDLEGETGRVLDHVAVPRPLVFPTPVTRRQTRPAEGNVA